MRNKILVVYLAVLMFSLVTLTLASATPAADVAPLILPGGNELADGMLFGVDWQDVSDTAFPGQDVAIPIEIYFDVLITPDARSHTYDPLLAQQLIGGTYYSLHYSHRQAAMVPLVASYLDIINVTTDLVFYPNPQDILLFFPACVAAGEQCICLDLVCSQYYDEPAFWTFLPIISR